MADLSRHGFPDTMSEIVDGNDEMLRRIRNLLSDDIDTQALDAVELCAPVPRPRRNVMCVGKNYYEHSLEFERSGFDHSSSGSQLPDHPIIFTKAPSSVVGPGKPIPSFLDTTDTTDYEGELAVVIGRGGRGIARAEAMDHVYGYTIVNDVTARALQQRHKQWFLGKSPDGFCPMGPFLVTADEVPDLSALKLSTWVNNERRQHAVVADLIFDVPCLIETISATMTLESGDIIATGTPVGVGIGRDPKAFLRAGDVVRVEIDGLGTLENPVI